MKQIFIVITCMFLLACGGNLNKNETAVDSTILEDPTLHKTELKGGSSEYETYYIVVVDTSKNYYNLQRSMFVLADKSLIEIDTMDRYYDSKMDLICLPDNGGDYYGDYIPKRAPSNTLSLEYFNFYNPSTGEKMIALLAGIYEGEEEANVRLAEVKKVIKTAFVIKSEVFVGGC